ncbi:MAG TPA: FG-GAP-like repeat-containing protein, partial [Bacteroidales bacterium]|nr:FG-GAP-like repeat-containing protein [Bacteroidales bacterium]
KDLLDRDFLDMYSDPSVMRSIIRTSEKAIMHVIGSIPSVKIPNYAFHNNSDMTFTNFAGKWGLDEPSFSNGAAYGDLDNDGDLDLVVNNVNMEPFIYRNESHKKENGRNYIILKLKGKGKNTDGLGAFATVYTGAAKQWKELSSTRGFQSSSDNRLHFGLGNAAKADSIVINWTNGSVSVLYDLTANQILTVSQTDGKSVIEKEHESDNKVFSEKSELKGFDFIHHENAFVDFERDRLIFGMLSNEGPHMAIADIDNNGTQDVFICGAKGEPGALYRQYAEGRFKSICREIFEKDSISEDTDCIFFDADQDGDMDLCVASGGNEFPSTSSALADRLYLNNGKGEFSLSQGSLPLLYESTSCLRACDYDRDGDMDLFAGTRLVPFAYGLPARSHLLENDGKGHFTDVTSEKAPALLRAGMVTDMSWADIDNDKDDDIILAGEWMPAEILINNEGKFMPPANICGLEGTAGLWHRITAHDLNGDGLIDFVLGNNGLNSSFKATSGKPLLMYVNDFDMNGTIEQIICISDSSKKMPLVMKDDLVNQIPSLRARYRKFSDYSNQGIEDIFSENVLDRSVKCKAFMMQTCVLINKGGCKFEITPLPSAAQLSPVYAIAAGDFDKDGIEDIILGGNQYRSKPEIGINDASYGVFLKGEPGNRWTPLSSRESGLFIKGEVRDFKLLRSGERNILAVAMNDDKPKFFEY